MSAPFRAGTPVRFVAPRDYRGVEGVIVGLDHSIVYVADRTAAIITVGYRPDVRRTGPDVDVHYHIGDARGLAIVGPDCDDCRRREELRRMKCSGVGCPNDAGRSVAVLAPTGELIATDTGAAPVLAPIASGPFCVGCAGALAIAASILGSAVLHVDVDVLDGGA